MVIATFLRIAMLFPVTIANIEYSADCTEVEGVVHVGVGSVLLEIVGCLKIVKV